MFIDPTEQKHQHDCSLDTNMIYLKWMIHILAQLSNKPLRENAQPCIIISALEYLL